MASEIEEANALARQALELAGREQDMLERAHPSADTHEFTFTANHWIESNGENPSLEALPKGSGWFLLSADGGCMSWARKKERQDNGK